MPFTFVNLGYFRHVVSLIDLQFVTPQLTTKTYKNILFFGRDQTVNLLSDASQMERSLPNNLEVISERSNSSRKKDPAFPQNPTFVGLDIV